MSVIFIHQAAALMRNTLSALILNGILFYIDSLKFFGLDKRKRNGVNCQEAHIQIQIVIHSDCLAPSVSI
jgi:hypothetical protein